MIIHVQKVIYGRTTQNYLEPQLIQVFEQKTLFSITNYKRCQYI